MFRTGQGVFHGITTRKDAFHELTTGEGVFCGITTVKYVSRGVTLEEKNAPRRITPAIHKFRDIVPGFPRNGHAQGSFAELRWNSQGPRSDPLLKLLSLAHTMDRIAVPQTVSQQQRQGIWIWSVKYRAHGPTQRMRQL